MALALDDDGKAIKGEAESEEIAGLSRLVPGPQGLPMFKPPYSRITAIDLNTGEHLWMKPNGPGSLPGAGAEVVEPGLGRVDGAKRPLADPHPVVPGRGAA